MACWLTSLAQRATSFPLPWTGRHSGKGLQLFPLATGRVEEELTVQASRAEGSSLIPGIARFLAPLQVRSCCPQDTPSLGRLLKCDFPATLPNGVLPVSTLATWTQRGPARGPDGYYRTRRTASSLSRNHK